VSVETGPRLSSPPKLWDISAALGVPLSQLIGEAELDPDAG
jgi:hypothetical protein